MVCLRLTCLAHVVNVLAIAQACFAAGWTFESDRAGRRPEGLSAWAPNKGAGPGRYAVSEQRAHSGKRSLRIEIPRGGYLVVWDYAAVREGKNYLLEGYVFLEPGSTARANMTIYWSAARTESKRLENVRHPSTPPVSVTGGWQRTAITAVAPHGAKFAQVVMRLSGMGNDGAGVAYFDDVSLTRIPDDMTIGPDGELCKRIVVPNARFDKGDPNRIEGWELRTIGGEYAAGRVVEDGNACAHLAFRKRTADRCRGSIVSPPFEVGKPSSHYRISVRLRGRNGLGRLVAHVLDAKTGKELNFWALRLGLPAQWGAKSGLMRILPRFRNRELAFRIELSVYGPGEAWFDDVRVARAEAPDIYWKRDAVYNWNPKSPLLIPRKPADREVVRVNPPAFVFPPTHRARTYRVEIASSPRFDADRVLSEPQPSNCYLHTAPLDPSKTWHWRAMAYDRDGKLMRTSETWSFTIAPDAVKWPFPPLSELASKVGPHPRLYVTKAGLPARRAAARSSASMSRSPTGK